MKVEKERCKVNIICQDGTSLKGFLHLNPGERVLDFMNDPKENFVAVTEAEFCNIKGVRSFKMFSERIKKQQAVILNKSAVKLIEEI